MTVLFADFGGEGAFWVQNGSNIASHAAHFTAGLCKSRDMHAGALAVCMSHARRSCRAGVLVAGFTAGRVLTIGHGGSLTSQSGYTIVQWLWQLHIPSLSPAAGFWSSVGFGSELCRPSDCCTTSSFGALGDTRGGVWRLL
jgi:hypothetical protein